MATRLFLRDLPSSLGGAGQKLLSARAGGVTGGVTAVTTTTNGGTNIQVTQTAGGQVLTWFSEPLLEAVAFNGTSFAPNIRGRELDGSVNAARGFMLERTNSAGTVLGNLYGESTISPATPTEYTFTDAANSGINFNITSVINMAVGERIKITLKVRNANTMGAGTVTNTYDGPSSAAAGGTYFDFEVNFRTDEPLDVPHYAIGGKNAYYG